MVLLGIHAMRGEWHTALTYLVPVAAFAAGIIVAECIRARFRDASGIHWRQLSVLAELCILLAVAFLPQSLNMAANVSVSFVCAVQVESFRKVHGNAFATTMCTGNLRSGRSGSISSCAAAAIRSSDGRRGSITASSYALSWGRPWGRG